MDCSVRLAVVAPSVFMERRAQAMCSSTNMLAEKECGGRFFLTSAFKVTIKCFNISYC